MKKVLSLAQKGLVLSKDKKKLLVIKYSESKYTSDKVAGKMGFPGGQIDFGENPNESFIREVKEETGVVVKPSLPFDVWSWTYKKEDTSKQIVAIARLAFYKSGKLHSKSINETETKIEEVKWIPIKNLKIKDFIVDEQPVLKKFLKCSKSNPFNPSS
jgi:8-oxo-dGTP pyrophosphatase MutT (NUDIX family)